MRPRIRPTTPRSRPDKLPLLPGQTATLVNYTSYVQGINGLMIDIAGLPGTQLSAEDFVFRAGDDANPDAWNAAPAPSSISVRAGAGAGGAARVTIIWPDGAIVNQWLQVTARADADTGLANPDVFYFGNAVGDTGDSAADAQVTDADVQAVIAHPRSIFNPAVISDYYDFNRDRMVNANDAVIARQNQTTEATALLLLSAPAVGGAGGDGLQGASVPAAPQVASPASATTSEPGPPPRPAPPSAPLAVAAMQASPAPATAKPIASPAELGAKPRIDVLAYLFALDVSPASSTAHAAGGKPSVSVHSPVRVLNPAVVNHLIHRSAISPKDLDSPARSVASRHKVPRLDAPWDEAFEDL